jgi:hypothetical protein
VLRQAYLNRMEVLSKEMTLSSRIRFMLLDVLEMRESGWRERRKKDGPKTIDQVNDYCFSHPFPDSLGLEFRSTC